MSSLRHRAASTAVAAALATASLALATDVASAEELLPSSVANGSVVPPPAPPVPPVLAAEPPPAAPNMTPAERRHQRAVALRRRLVVVAKSKLRRGRYVAGAAGPNAFDCSGFTMWLYRTVAHKRLSHYSGAQMGETHRVSSRRLEPGDLLFWGPRGSQHVSMYIGKGRMIGANNPRSGIRIESVNAPWWRGKLAAAGRVIMG